MRPGVPGELHSHPPGARGVARNLVGEVPAPAGSRCQAGSACGGRVTADYRAAEALLRGTITSTLPDAGVAYFVDFLRLLAGADAASWARRSRSIFAASSFSRSTCRRASARWAAVRGSDESMIRPSGQGICEYVCPQR